MIMTIREKILGDTSLLASTITLAALLLVVSILGAALYLTCIKVSSFYVLYYVDHDYPWTTIMVRQLAWCLVYTVWILLPHIVETGILAPIYSPSV